MERHESFWIDTSERPTFPVISSDVHVDVAIVGGGIVGIMAATFLKELGRRSRFSRLRGSPRGVPDTQPRS